MTKKIIIGLLIAIATVSFIGFFQINAKAAVADVKDIYPRFDIKGELTLRVPSTDGRGDEVFTYHIVEENRDLTSLTCLEDTIGNSDVIEVFFTDNSCILFCHRDTAHSSGHNVIKRIYTDYSADISLEHPLPVTAETVKEIHERIHSK